jgi:hypothetical protein
MIDSQQNLAFSPALLTEPSQNFVSRDKVLDFYKDFRAELADLITNFSDDSQDLELDGRVIAADQKYGAAGTYLVENWLSEQQFVFSQLLEAYKFEQTLENKLNSITGA